MKKIITTLFMLFMLFACCTAYAQSEEVIMELFCNDTLCEDGRFYGGKLTLNSKVKAKLSNGEALAIVAQYDDEGNLLDVALSKNVVEQENDEITVSLLSAQETGIVKCMIFDAKTLEPICPAQVYAAYDKNVTIWADMLEPRLSTTSSTKYTTIEYYATPEASNTIKLYVDKNPIITVNGVRIFESDIDLYRTYAYYITKIQFTENTEDAYYDVIDITVYEHGIVSQILYDKSRIIFEDGNIVTFDFDNMLFPCEFFDKDGNESSFESISNGDIIAMVVGELHPNGLTPINARGASDIVSVHNLKNNYISGKLVGHDSFDGMMYINDIPYCYCTYFVSEAPFRDVLRNGEMRLGIEGDFYLSINNSVIGFKQAKSSYNYGFIIQGAESSSIWEKNYIIKVLTDEGAVKTYTIAEEVEIEGIGEVYFTNQDKYFKLPEFSNFIYDASQDEYICNPDAPYRVITYKTNSNDVITYIDFIGKSDYRLIDASVAFNAATNRVGGVSITPDTIIFNVDVVDGDYASILDIGSLIDEGTYSGYAIDNGNNGYNILLITDGAYQLSNKTPLKIVDKVIEYLHNDEPAYKVFYYTDGGGERKSVFFTADSVNLASSFKYTSLNKGSIFACDTTDDNVVKSYVVFANVNSSGSSYNLNGNSIFCVYDEDTEVVCDQITDITYSNTNIIITTSMGESYTIDGATNQYHYNSEGARAVLETGDILGKNVDCADDRYANYIFLKLCDNRVTDAITFSARVEY